MSREAGVPSVLVAQRLLLASPRGYCAGVERAVDTVLRALELHGAPVYVRQPDRPQHPRRRATSRSVAPSSWRARRTLRTARCSSSRRTASRPPCHERADARRLRTIDATCPLVTQRARRGAPLRRRRRHRRPGRPRRTRRGRGNPGRGAGVHRARRDRRRCRARAHPRSEARRVRHPDDAVGGRDRRDHRRPPPPLPRDRGAGRGRHLLRDDEPPAGGEGARRRGRPRPRDRLEELLQLEPPGRDGAGGRRRGAPDRRRERDRRVVARRRRHRRPDLRGIGAGSARAAGLRLVPSSGHRGPPVAPVLEDVFFRLPVEVRRIVPAA